MPSIDYAAQFKVVTYETVLEMNRTWKRHRDYYDPKVAFLSAQRSESRGIDVAFATAGDGVFHVWTGFRDDVDGCCACGYLFPLSDLVDQTREGYDPAKVMVCTSCLQDEQDMGDEDDEEGTTYHAETLNGVGLVYRDDHGLGSLIGTYSDPADAERVAAYLSAGGAEVAQTPAALWLAQYDSGSFTFRAVGFTEEQARQAVEAGMQRHAAGSWLPADWYCADDINAYEIPVGGCLRDDYAL